MNSKYWIRKTIKEKLLSLSPQSHLAESKAVLGLLEKFPAFEKAKNLLLYVSKPYEVYTHDFILQHIQHKNIILPRVNFEKQSLDLYHITSWNDLEAGPYDLLEPTEDCKMVSLLDVDLAVIPGIAFTLSGKRLGHGKGYYDKLLGEYMRNNVSKTHILSTVSLSLSEQLLEDIPVEPHDIKIQHVLYVQ